MIARRPRILFISSCWPHGPAFGGQLRALHTARSLQQLGEVTLLVAGSEAHNVSAARLSAEEFQVITPAPALLEPRRTPIERLRWAFDLRYLNIHGFAVSAAERERILALRANYDLTWVLNSRTPNLLQIWDWPGSHLDFDDIPSGYARSAAATARTIAQRYKIQLESRLLHRREKAFTQRFKSMSVCSEADQAYLGAPPSTHVIPNGFPRPQTAPQRTPATQPPRLGFIGLYSYPPNLDGVRWFLREVWPLVRRAIPGIRFRLIGKDTDGPQRPADAATDALGWVADPAGEIATWSAMVIPIRLGAGTRIKIADSFSRRCPVVSTSLGAYGYNVEHGKHLMLADTPEAFAAACIDLVRSPQRSTRLADNAWNQFLQQWTWEAITPRIHAAAETCLSLSAASEICKSRTNASDILTLSRADSRDAFR